MNYSRRQLEAFGEPLGESATRVKPGGRIYGGGGGGGPTSSTVTQSNIPDYLRPQVEQLIGGATEELFRKEQQIDPATGKGAVDADGKPIYDIVGTKPFTPYSTDPKDYIAGFSPLQQQVQANAANLQVPGQFNQATGLAGAAGMGGMQSAQQALGYGNAGFQSGMQGQMLGQQAAQQAAQRAAMGEQAAYGYGNMGVQAGLQGQQSGLMGQNLGMQGGAQFGNLGVQAGLQGQQSGLLGQNLGIQGGQFYGAQGAGYGADAASLAGQAQGYGGMGAGYGQQAAQLANTALNYGDLSSQIGRMGLDAQQTGRGVTAQSQSLAERQAAAGQDYARQMTDPYAVQRYMSPYQQSVTDLQVDAARRQADISRTQRGSQAARAGAFGGARQAIENAEAERALQSQLSAIQAQGSQAAYDKAVQAMQYGSNLGLQGLSGAQSGLGTALQGGQLGLSGIGQALAGQQAAMQGVGQAGSMYGLGMQGAQSGLAGLQAANQLYGTGIQGAGLGLQGVQSQLAGTAQGMQGAQAAMQGAGVGLSGVDRQLAGTAQGMQGAQSAMQGAGVGLSGVDRALASGQLALQGADRGLAGTAQGMQGAQVGLQGVSGAQAGYGLANQSAGQLGQLGTQQLAAQTGILGLQNQIGGQQQAQEQQIINQAIQNYANAQNAPMDSYNQFNALLRGYALPGTTSTQYQAQANPLNQITGAGATLLAANNLTKGAAGGRPKDFKRVKRSGLHTLALRNALRG